MSVKTRTLPRLLLGALLGALSFGLPAPSPADAEDYPSRPITIVVSLAAGSGMDTVARIYA
jgi:tripartite-type tricarboxylate transporter receptor subunit TctC